MLVISNNDQPGVIGEVGTILGRHQINIASFALGRGAGGAVGVVALDRDGGSDDEYRGAIEELRSVRAIKNVRLVTSGPAASLDR